VLYSDTRNGVRVNTQKTPKAGETRRKTAKDDEVRRKMTKHDEIQHKLTKTRIVYYKHRTFIASMKINYLQINLTLCSLS